MLEECRKALRITETDYDTELCRLMDAGARDLKLAGVIIPGTVSFAATNAGMEDESTLTDGLVITAILTYVRMMFGSPPDYDKLKESYEQQKVLLMHGFSGGYTDGDSA